MMCRIVSSRRPVCFPWVRTLGFAAAFFAISGGSFTALAAVTPLAIDRQATGAPQTVGFQKDILPMFQANCLPCHNQNIYKCLSLPILKMKVFSQNEKDMAPDN